MEIFLAQLVLRLIILPPNYHGYTLDTAFIARIFIVVTPASLCLPTVIA
jgi:hypothetical protein